jgi:hypothetical protein
VYANGVWKDGKPWEGVCGVMTNVNGFDKEVFAEYKQGSRIRDVAPPAFQGLYKPPASLLRKSTNDEQQSSDAKKQKK